MPHLEDLRRKYDGENVEFVVVDVRNMKERTQEIVDDVSLLIPVLLDDKGVSDGIYDVRATPTTYLIDGTGRIIFKHLGYMPGMEEMLDREISLLIQRS